MKKKQCLFSVHALSKQLLFLYSSIFNGTVLLSAEWMRNNLQSYLKHGKYFLKGLVSCRGIERKKKKELGEKEK